MAVVVTEAHRPYWRYQVHDLAAGQEIPAGEFADFLIASGAPVETVSEAAGEVDPDAVPDGSGKDVLGWVGDDPARAARALEAESGREAPRKTLVAALEKLATADA